MISEWKFQMNKTTSWIIFMYLIQAVSTNCKKTFNPEEKLNQKL